MTNNDIFKKLRVALQLRDDEIVKILELVDFRITRSELGAFFRKEDHPNYMECGDQVLRNFLNGLVIHLRGPKPVKGAVAAKGTTPVKSSLPAKNEKDKLKKDEKPKPKKDA